MKLKRLLIRRMPGIERELALVDLVDGLNLIVGANGSGKTALCRTFGAVVWPELESGRGFSGEAVWRSGGERVTVRRDGERVGWQREGSPCERPRLPEPHTARCFTLDFRDLMLDGSDTDETVAAEVRTQTSGGYDLDRVIADGLALRPRHGINEDNRLRERSRDLELVRRSQRELGDRERERLELERELATARTSASRLEPLRAAIAICRVREERLSIERRLEHLPEGLELVRGDEQARLAELERERSELGRTREECADRIDRLEEEKRRLSPPAGLPAGSGLKVWVHRARTLHQQESELRQAQRTCSEADAARRAAATGLDPERVAGTAPSIDETAIAQVEAFVERAARFRARREQLNDEREALGEPAPAPDSEDDLESATEHLRSWLAGSAIRGAGWGRWAAILGFVSLAGAVGLWMSGADLLFSVASATAGGVLLIVAILSVAAHPSASRLQAARREFEELDLSPPESWDDDAVRRRLRELQKARSEAAFAGRQRRQREELDSRLEALEQQQSAIENERRELRRRFGVDPGSGELEPLRFFQRVERYQFADARYREGRAKLDQVGRQHAASLEALNGFVEQAELPSVTDAAAALAALDDLRDRGRRIQHIGEQLEREVARSAEIEQLQTAIDQKLDQVFVLAGLAPGDRDGLASRLASRPEYVSLVEELRARSASLEELERRSDGLAAAEDYDERRLAELVLEAEDSADRVVALAEERGKILQAVRDARAGQLMEDALAGVDEARESLLACRDEALFKTAGRFLIGRVADEFDRNSRPEILSRAIDLFGRFTHQRFELKVDLTDSPPRFRAIEVETGHGKALSELSSATRLQLLLAARLAYVVHIDPDARLPLLLDEVLATSDPERFVAIAESLLMLAREERRQILYFTSDPADVLRWQQVVGAGGLPMPRLVALGSDHEANGDGAGTETTEIPPIPEVPAPVGADARLYGARLGVPRVDPERSVNSLHLFHLMRDDLERVHQLLTARIRTVGQWRRLAQTGDGLLLLGDGAANRLSGRADVAEAFFDSWRIGRGRPIDTNVLAAADVSEAWVVRLESLVDELQGDALGLLDALTVRVDERTKGFHTRVRRRLREQLIAGGYLDERETLLTHEIHARVRAAVAAHVESGLLSAEEVATLVHQLLHGADPPDSKDTDHLAGEDMTSDGGATTHRESLHGEL